MATMATMATTATTATTRQGGCRPAAAIDASRAGIGLRTCHYQELLATLPRLSFLEVHSENYFGAGGQPLAYLERFRGEYALSLHGVGLSLGSTDPLSKPHLSKLKRLIERFEPALVSEHICWSGVAGAWLNDLLPLPYTGESLAHMVGRVQEAQDFLGRQLLLENVSSYLEYTHSTIPEWEFVSELARRSGCGLLLDVNNLYVNSVNHHFDALIYLRAIPVESVKEIHLAGFERVTEDDGVACLIDTHGHPVSGDVWRLFDAAIARLGPVPTLVEWDTGIPSLATLLGEAERVTTLLGQYRDRTA